MHGHYASDCLENRDAPRPNYNNNHGFNNKKFNDRRRDVKRERDAPGDRKEGHVLKTDQGTHGMEIMQLLLNLNIFLLMLFLVPLLWIHVMVGR